jgi:hypothetical protein
MTDTGYDYSAMEIFELRTETGTFSNLEEGQENAVDEQARAKTTTIRTPDNRQQLTINSCIPDAIRVPHPQNDALLKCPCSQPGCASTERCIARAEDPDKGWCITDSLRESILQS